MLQAGDVLHEVAPMRSDIADGGARASLVDLEAPRVVGRVEQPVLQVGAVDEVQRPQLAGRDERTRVLNERIAAIVERDGMDDAGTLGGLKQRARLGRRGGQRLVRDDVLAALERRHDDRRVQVVRCGVVHHVHVGIGDERLVAAVGPRDAEHLGLPRG